MDYGLCQMRPLHLRFTHDSVSCKFSNGMLLEDTFRQFLYDELDIDDMQCLVAMYHNGKWMVVRGNRRLYLYKKLESVGKLKTVQVDKQRFEQLLFSRQYTSNNMGLTLRIRGFPNIDIVLNQISNEWRNNQSQNWTSRKGGRRSKSPHRSRNTNVSIARPGQRQVLSNDNWGTITTSSTSLPNKNYPRASQKDNVSSTSNTTPHVNQNYSLASLAIRQSSRSTTSPSVNQNYSRASSTNSQQSWSTTSPSVNQNYSFTSSTYRQPPKSTTSSSVNQNYPRASPTSSLSSRPNFTLSVNRNNPSSSQTNVHPRSSRYIVPTPSSVHSNYSGTSQPSVTDDIPSQGENTLQKDKRKLLKAQNNDKTGCCCTIL